MSRLNNWFIGLGVLSTNGLVWGDIMVWFGVI